MNRKKAGLIVAIVAAAVVGTLLVGGTLAVAATQTGTLPRPMDAIAKLLGLDRTDIMRQRMAGKSLADIAKAKGVDREKLTATMIATRKARLDAAVKAGRLTQAEADKILDAYKKAIDARITNTAPCTPGAGRGGAGGCGLGGAGGGCGGFGGRGSGQGAGFRGTSGGGPAAL